MKLKCILIVACSLFTLTGQADEGMWMLGNLNKQTRKTMKELGLQMPADKLYNPKKPSLKDAVVSFGGFCSGVVVSEDGLVFTNHHCGFSSVQQHSSVEHDYLKDGFVARSRAEELPNPELYVRFLLRTEDVTKRVLGAVKPSMNEMERSSAVDSMMMVIGGEVSLKDSTLLGVVDAYYGGNEFWLSVYRDFNDVRLVFAPPSSVGKFGWDTDNWVWPRHTGDFCVFRIYADHKNRPADYSPDNVPYHPEYVAPISLDGYKEGSFCMTIGYPGSTERYLSSFGIEEMMNNSNQAQIDIRGVKQAIWKREMDSKDSIRIKYASKYDESSNYWKNSIGVNRAIRKLGILEKKREMEQEIRRWIQQNPDEREKLLQLFTDLELNYKNRREVNRAQAYFIESFLYGPELVQLALKILNFDFEGEQKTVIAALKDIVEQYSNLDLDIDKEVFTALLKEYRLKVDTTFLPEIYHTIAQKYNGDEKAFVDSLYASSELTTPRGLKRFLERDTTYQIFDDPAISLGIDMLTMLFDMNMQMQAPTTEIIRGERLLNGVIRRMYTSRNFYPDANSTMRLSFGTVCGYTPFDGAEYDYYTTTKGVLEKVKAHVDDVDFAVQPEVLSLLSSGNFGRYADEKGEMKVCFISNNDITGGNSGSAMFNSKGELLGLAFDGNWEAMGSDILYEPKMQRTIGVDVRYILFIIEKYGKAGNLIQELNILN
ncbi:S46 family peptidase [Bacteroides cellulosilyticus]|uniref:S46 family peptidase n=1 Tax=Bacteroides cellulosilyticus TaxID=246787 RepID=UPI001C3755C6|nr:S46 family peptidase [Bacteroides cellulosilyticus]MBV3635192.1 S46 family peptidase [Bacteroides cellulosilyticus]MBV3661463.1 S46 family peptidase [Bacteroides cellulosilyticus]MBV3683730.1 S46 family peptidase [Bacteroides cellulosilyticus]MBV3691781.1 S46 family peptidase [Bacteroides cellulosilyticus]MBV3705618.1 S46 family peptidase [Bacteroides cellulosilyticus]